MTAGSSRKSNCAGRGRVLHEGEEGDRMTMARGLCGLAMLAALLPGCRGDGDPADPPVADPSPSASDGAYRSEWVGCVKPTMSEREWHGDIARIMNRAFEENKAVV